MCSRERPRGQERPRGLHLCQLLYKSNDTTSPKFALKSNKITVVVTSQKRE